MLSKYLPGLLRVTTQFPDLIKSVCRSLVVALNTQVKVELNRTLRVVNDASSTINHQHLLHNCTDHQRSNQWNGCRLKPLAHVSYLSAGPECLSHRINKSIGSVGCTDFFFVPFLAVGERGVSYWEAAL